MSKFIFASVIIGAGAIVANGAFGVFKGANAASAVKLYEVSSDGVSDVTTLLASHTSPTVQTGAALEGAVGIVYEGQAGDTDQLFVLTVGDRTPVPGVIVLAPVASGQVTSTRRDSANAGFITGVALGVALAAA